ncbi:MAG: glycerol-3-phosphate dehydrogenase, partial [Halobacteriaceae archaeon]
LLEELADLVPAIAEGTPVRTYAGLRPLVVDDPDADMNEVTRDFRVFDHGPRDGVAGLTTVVGGKLTTHRLMAEAVADRVCAHLGVDVACRTGAAALPAQDDPAALCDLVAEAGGPGPADAAVEEPG